MIPPLHPRLVKIAHSVRVSAILEKLAEAHEDKGVREKAAAAKVSVDTAIFGMAHFTIDTHVKTAAAENPIQHSASIMTELALSLYGFDKLSNHEPVEDSPFLQEALQKVATVGAIEGLLNLVPPTVSEDAMKVAAELRTINRHYGAKLLYELTEGSREKTAQSNVIIMKEREKKKLGPLARAAKQQGGTLEAASERVQEQRSKEAQTRGAAAAWRSAALPSRKPMPHMPKIPKEREPAPTPGEEEAGKDVKDYAQLDLKKLLGNR